MPSDEYFAVGGPLRLKGAKFQKRKKKKEKTDLQSKLAAGGDAAAMEAADADDNADKEEKEAPTVRKTEAEQRFEEAKRRRLRDMAQSGSRSGLLKTHKERVEELNTYLSKLSEHHDMPKIGPG